MYQRIMNKISRMFRLILAAWRITSLLVQERGPDAIFSRLREHYKGSEVGKALECIWCTSLYVAGFVILLDMICPRLVDILAISAGAIVVDKHNSN